MALTPKIVQKVKDKTRSNKQLETALISILRDMEQGRQGKPSVKKVLPK